MARADTVIVCLLPLAKNALHSPTSIPRLLGGYSKYPKECVDNPEGAARGIITHS